MFVGSVSDAGVTAVKVLLLLALYNTTRLSHILSCAHYFLSGDSAVMGQRGGTFAAADERRGAAAALEMAIGRLKTLEWRIGFIRRGVREPEG